MREEKIPTSNQNWPPRNPYQQQRPNPYQQQPQQQPPREEEKSGFQKFEEGVNRAGTFIGNSEKVLAFAGGALVLGSLLFGGKKESPSQEEKKAPKKKT